MNYLSNIQSDFKKKWVLTTPVLVPFAGEANNLENEQRKFLVLPDNVKYKLSRIDISQKIQVIGQKYQFELLRLANITRLIREYYFGEVRFENFPKEIEKRMGVSLLTAQEITRYIKSEIIDWDPWAEYLAKLPKLPIREIAQKYPKMANMEITAGYIELKGSEDLEDPTIKNWLKDYVSHLGYDRHSQMDRAQYLFHSENGKDLSSQDREKLGIILKSFDENIPLPVDEENGEIVFDGIEKTSPQPSPYKGEGVTRPLPEKKSQPTPIKQDSFIKPYSPIQQPQKQASRPLPHRSPAGEAGQASSPQPTQTSPQPSPYQGEGAHPEINKYFSAPESLEIPEIKIHSITEHNETPSHIPPRAGSEAGKQEIAPSMNIQRPIQTLPHRQASSPQPEARPKYKIIDPFFSKPMPEPRLDGNIVDLSDRE